MDVLPLHFRTLQFFGIWSETSNNHWFVKYFWRLFNVIATILFTISQLAALLICRNSVADFTECLFLSIIFFGLCIKLVNWLCRLEKMVELLNEFRVKECLPRDKREQEIINGYEKVIEMVFKVNMMFALSDGILIALMPLIAMAIGSCQLCLPFKAYEIHDKNDLKLYWLTYAFQVYADFIGIFINISFDTIIAGFLLLTCAQIDLCCHRFMISSNNAMQKSIKECVVHQLLIRSIVRKIELFFMPVVVPLMLLSLITFCTSVYNLAQTDISGVQTLSLLIYIVCLLGQLGCYCWFGNELKVKNNAIRETMYNSDWISLTVKDRKSLYLIMLFFNREMVLSFHGFCMIDMEIFVWVLKASYSAYNLLKAVE